ncbi:c-type cytochrome [Acidisphaera sp. L21]|uniref:c-type cytochrome n=1 Tax=Acidisphaera sp. L21 TaxID=1641851 RepID=UPI00131BAC2F|nr:c-type cytochrome [Acidisphaera sp. L21]
MKARSITLGLAILVAGGSAAFAGLAWRPAIGKIASPTQFDRALVAKGAQLAAVGDCAICHAGSTGTPFAGGNPLQTPFGAVYASNITPDPDAGIGTWSLAAFRRAMHDGVDRAGGFLYPAFPYNHYTHVTGEDVDAIYAFLMTRTPAKLQAPATHLPFPFNIRLLMAGWNALFVDHSPVAADPAKNAAWNRGAYLVEGLGHCAACHSPRNALGAEDKAHPFTGGEVDGWDAPGLTAATSPAAIAWTAGALYRFLRHGLDDQHAASAGPMGAVSHDLSNVPEADVRAIAIYIASMTDPDGRGAAEPTREQQVAARVAAAQIPPPELQQTSGAAIFAGACAGCHGAGAPMMLNGRPSLALGSSVTAATPRNASQTILYGLQPGPGERGPWMPGFAGSLTDDQVAAVLTYLRWRFTDRPAWPALEDNVHRIRQDKSS